MSKIPLQSSKSLAIVLEKPAEPQVNRRKLALPIREKEWDKFKSRIKIWHRDHTVLEIQKLLRDQGLDATFVCSQALFSLIIYISDAFKSEDQLRTRIAKWGWRKYSRIQEKRRRGLENGGSANQGMGAMQTAKSPPAETHAGATRPKSAVFGVTLEDGDVPVYLEYTRKKWCSANKNEIRFENTILLRWMLLENKEKYTTLGFQIMFHQKLWDHMRLSVSPVVSFHRISDYVRHRGGLGYAWKKRIAGWPQGQGWGEIHNLVGRDDLDLLQNKSSMEEPLVMVTGARSDSTRGFFLE
ncbi:hypothetical protein TWF281_001482 [Arthrobotrys megalospora]